MKKGFTLIELLVVISIIGLLSSIALASLKSARDKAADATIKQNLSGLRVQSELFFEEHNDTYTDDVLGSIALVPGLGFSCLGTIWNGTYNFFDDGTGVYAAIEAAELRSGSTAICNIASYGWMAYVPLKTNPGQAWCVDGAGFSGLINVPDPELPGLATSCPV